MEKTLRVLGGEDDAAGHSHSHSHSHSHDSSSASATGADTDSTSKEGLRSRKTSSDKDTGDANGTDVAPTNNNGPSKLSAYLNLFGGELDSCLKTKEAS
jgi:solute carrier family 39 (zinc transporter), member 7